jgi:hypothetical protein
LCSCGCVGPLDFATARQWWRDCLPDGGLPRSKPILDPPRCTKHTPNSWLLALGLVCVVIAVGFVLLCRQRRGRRRRRRRRCCCSCCCAVWLFIWTLMLCRYTERYPLAWDFIWYIGASIVVGAYLEKKFINIVGETYLAANHPDDPNRLRFPFERFTVPILMCVRALRFDTGRWCARVVHACIRAACWTVLLTCHASRPSPRVYHCHHYRPPPPPPPPRRRHRHRHHHHHNHHDHNHHNHHHHHHHHHRRSPQCAHSLALCRSCYGFAYAAQSLFLGGERGRVVLWVARVLREPLRGVGGH